MEKVVMQTVASERRQHVVGCLFGTLSHQMHATCFVIWRSYLSAACDGQTVMYRSKVKNPELVALSVRCCLNTVQ